MRANSSSCRWNPDKQWRSSSYLDLLRAKSRAGRSEDSLLSWLQSHNRRALCCSESPDLGGKVLAATWHHEDLNSISGSEDWLVSSRILMPRREQKALHPNLGISKCDGYGATKSCTSLRQDSHRYCEGAAAVHAGFAMNQHGPTLCCEICREYYPVSREIRHVMTWADTGCNVRMHIRSMLFQFKGIASQPLESSE